MSLVTNILEGNTVDVSSLTEDELKSLAFDVSDVIKNTEHSVDQIRQMDNVLKFVSTQLPASLTGIQFVNVIVKENPDAASPTNLKEFFTFQEIFLPVMNENEDFEQWKKNEA